VKITLFFFLTFSQFKVPVGTLLMKHFICTLFENALAFSIFQHRGKRGNTLSSCVPHVKLLSETNKTLIPIWHRYKSKEVRKKKKKKKMRGGPICLQIKFIP